LCFPSFGQTLSDLQGSFMQLEAWCLGVLVLAGQWKFLDSAV